MGSILSYYDGLSSVNYHALQLQAQHRFSRGLQFGAAYTFSKALGTCGAVALNGSGCTIGDPWHKLRQWYYGALPWDRTQVASVNFSYKIPSFTGNKIAKAIAGDWTMSGIAAFQTGAPVTPDCSSLSAGPANSDPSLSGVGAYSATNPGGARCQVVGDPKAFNKDFYNTFNTSAFTLAPAGTFGNVGIGVLRQPGWYNIDLTLDKRFPIGHSERRVLRARIEAYNLLNHTQFNSIGTSLQLLGATNVNTQYGQYTGTMPARVLSTTLRFEF